MGSLTVSSPVICGTSCCGCGVLVRSRAVARSHSTARLGVCRAGKRRELDAGVRFRSRSTEYILYCAPLWPNRADSSPRPFLSASRRCSPRAIGAVGLHVEWQGSFLTQVPEWSNQPARNWEFHLYDDFFQDGVQHDYRLFHYRRHTAHGSPHSGACIQGQDAAHTWCRGNHHCGAYIQGKGAAYRAQRVHHTSACEYSTACNSYAQFMHFMRSFSLRFYTVAAVV